MEQNNGRSTLWQRHRSYFINTLGFLGIVTLFLFWLPELLWLCWHYLACLLLVLACYPCKKEGKQGLLIGLTLLSFVIAVAGFFLIYQGPFVASNKSFYEYLTKYGPCTLPIFLFPCISLGFMLWKPKQ